ncbi:restriction endonuclease [Lysinibacillus sphaericus]|uniref:restriction endonuclease n=1 Tax=Lysinibacillus sphaericus TaxID=1421 RepID=UPI0037FB453E
MDFTLDQFLGNFAPAIEKIEENRNYWLVRTESGAYYNDYTSGNYIAIGWDEFSNASEFSSEIMSENMANKISKEYPDKQPGRIYNQIRKFLFDIKIGDVVMIPSENSRVINFGIVTSDYIARENNKVDSCPFIKSKSVNWIKSINRNKLDPYLFKMMQAHQTINNAKDYAHFIDRTMYSFYEKNEKSYLILPVNKKEDIPAFDLSQFINSITDLVPIINEIFESENDKRDLDIKINVQSPGYVELKSEDKKLVPRVLALLKFALTTKDDIGEVLEKTSLEKKQLLEKEKLELKEKFENVKAKLPKDL